MEGMIMKSTGSWYLVRANDGALFKARLRGKMKLEDKKVNNPVAVGDQVTFNPETDSEGLAMIDQVLPRKNYIIRDSTHRKNHYHVLAANLDQTVLIATLKMPRTSLGFIDRFLVTAEAYRIPATLIINKTDLLKDRELALLEELKALYTGLGYGFLATSAGTGAGLKAVKDLLKGKKSLLSGHSGVGKSSIINAIHPGLGLRTGEVSEYANKGTHTTTFAEMFELEDDTFIIDTPGIKELGIVDIEKEELSHFFPEMRARFGQCRFHNCTHVHEPGCKVHGLVETGHIALSRYNSYLSMLGGADNRK